MPMKALQEQVISEHQITEVELPVGSVVKAVEYLRQSKQITLWIETPASVQTPVRSTRFRVFRAGDGIPETDHYVGTAVDQYHGVAYHVYEIEGV